MSAATSSLQVLFADVICLDSFGAARGIQHLMLQTPYLRCDRLSSSLSALEQLQTLWVKDTVASRQHTCGALHLTALKRPERGS